MLSFLRFLLGMFTGRDRIVFRYWDGNRRRSADPVKLKAALDVACPDWITVAEDLVSAERTAGAGLPMGARLGAQLAKRREALTAKLVAAAREVLGIAEYSDVGWRETGLPDLQALDVLGDYLAWVVVVMRDTLPLLSGVPRTDSVAPPSPPASESASPSTPSELKTTDSTPSSEPSALHSGTSDD